MKRFIYNVSGTEFEGAEPFGQAWQDAKVLAEKEHTFITRTVIGDGADDVRYEYYANGGIFLADRFWDRHEPRIF